MESIIALLPWIQIVLSVLIILTILMQQNEAGLGAGFGGSSGDNVKRTRRGFEKTLFNTTIVLAVLFALVAILTLFLQ